MIRPRVMDWLSVAQVWRWRRVRRRGVVLSSRYHPAPDGIAFTWRGARVGNATRDQLAAALSGPPRRPEDFLSPEFLARLREPHGPMGAADGHNGKDQT